MTRMRAAVLDRYGPPEVLRVEEVERPIPGRGEVLIRVHAATVNRNDCAWRRGTPFAQRAVSGWRRPKAAILGNEFAGTVAEVGTEVSRFAAGDEVFGVRAYLSEGFGAQAEYLAVAATSAIARKPPEVSFEQAAAACDGALSSLPFLRKAAIGPGSAVLVYGASGAIGSAAVQLARHLGAEVTAFAGARNLELVRSLGAAEVLDYRQHDPASTGRQYDMIFDAVGRLSHVRMRRLLTERGVFASTGGLLNFVMVPLTARSRGRRVIFAAPAFSRPNVEFLADLMASGAYRPVIDRTYPLDQVVEANRYVESERKTGNVVLDITG
ncbi:MAG TPA: NAD(P)-dependent alcohol dehydrogenase [Patescibacteria group bacterium]|nr:NAD(P)-dependent alcohol dehydrogenase [Patescibacteria group bacterium]